ncbi:MAG: SH3 domain-containing protein, partial [Anaerolineae bacterium]|nr:SH3 domain-containing protein [Anaerolineae bacterium]
QDAVETPSGEVLMLGSSVAAGAPLQIINTAGEALTAPIGDVAPHTVRWSPDASAVLLQTTTATYVALTDGTVYDLTGFTENSPNIDWVVGGLPSTLRQVPLPEPIANAEDIEATRTAQPTVNATPMTYSVGQILVLTAGTLDIYTEPAGDADITGVMLPGDELIITAGPVEDGDTIWYRVQTINYTGWIRNLQNLEVAQ